MSSETIPVPAALQQPAAQVPDSNTPQTPVPAPAPEPAKDASAPSEQAPATPEPDADPQKPDEKKPKGRWSERVDQLTAKNHQLRAQLEIANRQLGELMKPLQAPDPANWEATEQHRLRSIMREERAQDVHQQAQTLQQQAAQTRLETFETKLMDAADRIKDIDQVREKFYQTVPITEFAADVLAESEHAADVTAHLVRNPDLAARFARMHPAQQVAEIGRLSGIYEARASAPPVRRVSQAPAPPPTLGGGAPATARSPEDMSVDQLQALFYRKK